MTSPTSAWTELAPGVLVRQSRAYRMNSTVIALDGHALVVDPGVLPSELDDMAARVAALAPQVTTPRRLDSPGRRWPRGHSPAINA